MEYFLEDHSNLILNVLFFTAIIVCGYWFAPYKNKFVLFFTLWFPYVALAWYDYTYHCEDKMKYTLFPFGKYIFLPFKPKEYQKNKALVDYLDHIYIYTIIIILSLVLFRLFLNSEMVRK